MTRGWRWRRRWCCEAAVYHRYQRPLAGTGIFSIDAPETPAAEVNCPPSETSTVEASLEGRARA
jgi:hypothetical protein